MIDPALVATLLTAAGAPLAAAAVWARWPMGSGCTNDEDAVGDKRSGGPEAPSGDLSSVVRERGRIVPDPPPSFR